MMKFTLHQKSRLGTKMLELEGDQLKVMGRVRGKAFESVFDLHDVAPHIERIRTRFYRLLAIPLGFAIVPIAAIWAFRFQDTFLQTVIVIPCGLIIIILLRQTWKGIAPLELIQFYSKNGAVLFDIIKEKHQAEECERFAGQICEHIKMVREGKRGQCS